MLRAIRKLLNTLLNVISSSFFCGLKELWQIEAFVGHVCYVTTARLRDVTLKT